MGHRVSSRDFACLLGTSRDDARDTGDGDDDGDDSDSDGDSGFSPFSSAAAAPVGIEALTEVIITG